MKSKKNGQREATIFIVTSMIAVILLSSGSIFANDTTPPEIPTETIQPTSASEVYEETLPTEAEILASQEDEPEATEEPTEEATLEPINPNNTPTVQETEPAVIQSLTPTWILTETSELVPTETVTETPSAYISETPTETPTVTPTETPTITPTVEPESLVEWTLKIDSINKNIISNTSGLESDLEDSGLSAQVESQSSSEYGIVVSGESDLNEIQEVLYDDIGNDVSFIGGAAEVTITMQVEEPQKIDISLESNLSTGYRWEVLEEKSQNISVIGEGEYDHREGLGNTEKQTLTVKAIEPGQVVVHLIYRRPFEKEETITRHLSVALLQAEEEIDLSNPNSQAISDSDDEGSSGNPIEDIVQATSLSSSFDWRDEGIIPEIRDQGSCGSCWAFSTVGVLESAILKSGQPEADLSEQFLVSCNKDSWSCDGGSIAHKYHYNTLGIKQSSIGAVLEDDMPYTASDESCSVSFNHPYKLSNWEYVSGSSSIMPTTAQIKNAIYNYGPVSTRICSGEAFQDYSGGIFSTSEEDEYCGGSVNHEVILVGWNDEGGYWILRNSWGDSWGEDGYMRIAYGTSLVGKGTSWVSYAAPIPAAPVLVSPKKGALTNDVTPELTWNRTENATFYRVEINESSQFYSTATVEDVVVGDALSYITDELPHHGGYDSVFYWRVRAGNSEGMLGNWSPIFSFTLDTSGPNAPVLSSPLNGSTVTGTPVFKWKSSTGAKYYQFEYNTTNDSETYIFRSGEISTLFITPSTLPTDELIYWYVRAKDVAGNWSDWSDPFTVKITLPVPGKPILSSPANNKLTNNTTPELSWGAVDYSQTYHVQVASDTKFVSIVEEQEDISELTYVLTGELADGKYYWRVRAENANEEYGVWSKANYFTIDTQAPAVPLMISPVNGAENVGIPTLKWKKATGAKYYQIEYNTVNDTESYVYRSDEMTATYYKAGAMEQMVGYYWYVRAKDVAGNWSDWSEPYTIMVVPPVPGKPKLISPASKNITNDTTPELSWGAVNYSETYHVQVASDTKFVSIVEEQEDISELTYVLTGELADGKYYWRVRAENANEDYGGWSKANYFTIDTQAPAAPLMISPVNGAENVGIPTLKWKKATGAKYYQMEYNTINDTESYVYRSDEMTATSFKASAMEQMVGYYWYVRAKDVAGNWGDWSEPYTIMVVPPVPGKPKLISPANNNMTNDTTPELSWGAVNYSETYHVQVASDTKFVSIVEEQEGVGELTYTLTGELVDGKYYWRVRAENANDVYGGWSKANYFTIDTQPPAAPVLNSPANGTQNVGTPALKWSKVSDAKYYEFQYNTVDDKETYVYRSSEFTGTTIKPYIMDQMVWYYWYVRAKDKAGNWSDWSEPYTVKVVPPVPAKAVQFLPANNANIIETSPVLSWQDASYGYIYQVEVDDSQYFTDPDYTLNSEVKANSLTVESLTTGKWYWRVRAQNKNGDYGAWSSTRSFTLYPSFDIRFNTEGDSEGWEKVSGADWTVQSGFLYTGGASILGYSESDFSDFTLETRFKVEDYSNLMRFYFRSDEDRKNGYCVTTYLYTGGIGLHKIEDGKTSYLSLRASESYIPHAWNTLKIIAKQKHLKILVNGVTVFDQNVSGPTDGKFYILYSVYKENENLLFDSIKVGAPE